MTNSAWIILTIIAILGLVGLDTFKHRIVPPAPRSLELFK